MIEWQLSRDNTRVPRLAASMSQHKNHIEMERKCELTLNLSIYCFKLKGSKNKKKQFLKKLIICELKLLLFLVINIIPNTEYHQNLISQHFL